MKACLIGGKLGYSFSKTIHEKLGTDYDLVEVSEQNLADFVNCGKYDFFNVTIPHKRAIVGLLNEVDETVLKTGCVNTVVRGNSVVGYNTDLFGVEYAFKRCGVEVLGKHAVVLGSGATSQTVCEFLRSGGAQSVTVVGRTSKFNYQNYRQLANTQILVNTTPVGTYPDCGNSLVDLSAFPSLEFVFDVVYNPLKTKLILQAEKMGIVCCGGLPMLVAQAVRSEEIWQNKCFSERIESLLAEVKTETANVVLVGMPACGKTTVGKILAQKLNKKFVDLDEEIARCGKSPEEIILQQGEEFFRKTEAETAVKFGKEHGLVIATGGGAVLNGVSVSALKQNGFVVWLNRDLQQLTAQNRPLSQKFGVEKLFEQRKSFYQSAADCVVQNDADADVVAVQIQQEFLRWVQK